MLRSIGHSTINRYSYFLGLATLGLALTGSALDAADPQIEERDIRETHFFMDRVIDVDFSQDRYDFSVEEARAGISIPYEIVIHQDVEKIQPLAIDDGGGLWKPGASGLTLLEKLHGNKQVYCLCDFGVSFGQVAPFAKLKKGRFEQTFTWDGQNWRGPSDTMAPKGPPFPPGDYTLTIRFRGNRMVEGRKVQFNLTESVPVRLTP